MTLDELIQLTTDKEITTNIQFYDYLINVDQIKNNNISIIDAQKIIANIFIGNNTIFTSKNNKKIKKIFKIIPSIINIDFVINQLIDDVLSGLYDDDINGISNFLTIIDNLLLINQNIDLINIYNKIIQGKPLIAQALQSKIKK